MVIFHVSDLILVLLVQLLDHVFGGLHHEVFLHVIVVLVLFDLNHFGLELGVMSLVQVFDLFLMRGFSFAHQFLEVLDLVVKLLNLINFILVGIVMGFRVIPNFLRGLLDVPLELLSGVF